MKVNIRPGKYVMAVSGGVDSAVLLDALSNQKDVLLIIAHFDHGIRTNSRRDRDFVEQLAAQYGLEFETAEGNLGKSTSEEAARRARYEFLNSIKEKHSADAIITAHHQDDVLETMIINLLRGTGRKGLSSLQSGDEIVRPLLELPKAEILTYAAQHHLKWHEDETNQDETYLRNWVRKQIVPKLSQAQRQQLLDIQSSALEANVLTDSLLNTMIDSAKPTQLSKKQISNLPHSVAMELIAHWLRTNNIRDIDSKMLERILIGAKTLASGRKIDVNKSATVFVQKDSLQLQVVD